MNVRDCEDFDRFQEMEDTIYSTLQKSIHILNLFIDKGEKLWICWILDTYGNTGWSRYSNCRPIHK